LIHRDEDDKPSGSVLATLSSGATLSGEGKTMPEVAKQLEVSEQTFHRWRDQNGG
jgi:transposase-like protein